MQVASEISLVRRIPTPLSTGLAVAVSLLFGACGQKGALRLPTVVPEALPAAAVAASAVPAAASAARR